MFARLRALFPQTWILDPRPLPPQAAIIGLTANGAPVHDWMQFEDARQGRARLRVKPSGSANSRGVRAACKIANDLTQEEWQARSRRARRRSTRRRTSCSASTKGRRVRVPFLSASTGEIKEMDGRVRLCPYYFVAGDAARLGGILATVAPADKRLIHGMSDAIMAPCAIADDGF